MGTKKRLIYGKGAPFKGRHKGLRGAVATNCSHWIPHWFRVVFAYRKRGSRLILLLWDFVVSSEGQRGIFVGTGLRSTSDSVSRVNYSTRVTLGKLWRLDSVVTFFTEWLDSSRNQWLESESCLQNVDRSADIVCTQRNKIFLLQWWLTLVQIFCFDCVPKRCYARFLGWVVPPSTEVVWFVAFHWGDSSEQ